MFLLTNSRTGRDEQSYERDIRILPRHVFGPYWLLHLLSSRRNEGQKQKMQRIVVMGAGTGGIMVANRMRRVFGRNEADITVLERSDRHVYQPGFVPLLFDLDKPENLVRPSGGIEWF